MVMHNKRNQSVNPIMICPVLKVVKTKNEVELKFELKGS